MLFSLDGLVKKETSKELEKWGVEVRDTVWSAMVKRMSLVLLWARAKVYEG